MSGDTKRCSKCGDELPLGCFNKNRQSKDGLACYCRECNRAKCRRHYIENNWKYVEYRNKNRDSIRAKRKAYSEANREQRRANWRSWYARNRESRLAYHREWKAANAEAVAAYKAATVEQRRESRLAYNRTEAGRAKIIASKELRRARKAAVPTLPFSAEDLAARWQYYGNSYWICGVPATETDHVKPLSKGGSHMLCNLRPVCKPCNSSKNNRWPYVPALEAAS